MNTQNEEQEAFVVEVNGEKAEVDKAFYHFLQLLKCRGEEMDSLSDTINEFMDFDQYWQDFRRSKAEPMYDNKKLNRFNLFHTIKPGTKYANQQDFDGKNPKLYPVYRIEDGTVYSMACGGNYPVPDCDFWVGDGQRVSPLHTPKKRK